MQLANENPAKKVEVILEAKISVKDQKPWSVFLTSDNTGNESTGRDRTGIALQHANLFNRDRGDDRYTSSLDRPESTRVYSFSYRLRLGRQHRRHRRQVRCFRRDLGHRCRAAAILRQGHGPYGLRYNYILPRSANTRSVSCSASTSANTTIPAPSPDCRSAAPALGVTVRPLSVTIPASSMRQARTAP